MVRTQSRNQSPVPARRLCPGWRSPDRLCLRREPGGGPGSARDQIELDAQCVGDQRGGVDVVALELSVRAPLAERREVVRHCNPYGSSLDDPIQTLVPRFRRARGGNKQQCNTKYSEGRSARHLSPPPPPPPTPS